MLEFFPVDATAQTQFAQRFTTDHKGTDIFAPMDTALFAVTNGTMRNATDPKGGNVVYLKGDDGRTYYYAHLSHFAHDESPRKVEAGGLVGYMGNTGNATSKAPHLHFEIHTAAGPIDPYPELEASKPRTAIAQPSSSSSSAWVLVALALFLLWRRR